jgi:hypothetical protein
MNTSDMYSNGVGVVVGNWRTLRVAEDAARRAASTHHAIPLPKRRTAAQAVASVNRGLT